MGQGQGQEVSTVLLMLGKQHAWMPSLKRPLLQGMLLHGQVISARTCCTLSASELVFMSPPRLSPHPLHLSESPIPHILPPSP